MLARITGFNSAWGVEEVLNCPEKYECLRIIPDCGLKTPPWKALFIDLPSFQTTTQQRFQSLNLGPKDFG
jgi:hypothetical protein